MANEFKVKNGVKFSDNTIQTTAAVTSVATAGTVSGITLTGGPITTTGTITLGGTLAVLPSNFASQTANTVLAAPDGSAGVPTFRALTLSDLTDSWVKRVVKATTLSVAGNITLSGQQTIDGISCVTGDRVLVRSQTVPQDNGIYVVQTGAWTRATDANTSAKMAGANVSVSSGTIFGGVLFDTDFKSTDTLGTTPMLWNREVDAGYFTLVGNAIAQLPSPSAVTFLRMNADNTASALNAADFRTAIGVSSGTLPTVSDTAPSSPTAGALWWDSTVGVLKIYYADGTSNQWVDASPAIQGAQGPQGIQGVQGPAGANGDVTRGRAVAISMIFG